MPALNLSALGTYLSVEAMKKMCADAGYMSLEEVQADLTRSSGKSALV